ncbi:hypothetical protein LEMLEM_LOCUS13438 [Lemmus lemmus]
MHHATDIWTLITYLFVSCLLLPMLYVPCHSVHPLHTVGLTIGNDWVFELISPWS